MTPHRQLKALEDHVNQRILGQETLVNRMLVQGVPGLAKTSAVRVMAAGLEGDFHRIQFTPDLLPADLTGTEVFRPGDSAFTFQRGQAQNTDYGYTLKTYISRKTTWKLWKFSFSPSCCWP